MNLSRFFINVKKVLEITFGNINENWYKTDLFWNILCQLLNYFAKYFFIKKNACFN